MTRPAIQVFSPSAPDNPRPRPFRIALLSDPHCWRLGVWPWELMGKRALGYYNLVFSRRHHFKADAFANALHRAQELRADLILITGDLTQTSLRSEFAFAADILAGFEAPTAIIPGNHDRYTYTAVWGRRFEKHLAEHGGIVEYPTTIKLTPHLWLICLDPCRPDSAAKGRLPSTQVARLTDELAAAKTANAGVIVACHYPVVQPPEAHASRSHRLVNAHLLLEMFRRHELPIVFCNGHIHQMWVHQPREVPNLLSVNPGSCGFFTAAAPFGMGFLELVAEPHKNGRLSIHAHRQDALGIWRVKDIAAGNHLIAATAAEPHVPPTPPPLTDIPGRHTAPHAAEAETANQ